MNGERVVVFFFPFFFLVKLAATCQPSPAFQPSHAICQKQYVLWKAMIFRCQVNVFWSFLISTSHSACAVYIFDIVFISRKECNISLAFVKWGFSQAVKQWGIKNTCQSLKCTVPLLNHVTRLGTAGMYIQ